MKKTFLLIVSMCACLCAFAQKPVVVIDKFHAPSIKQADVANLRNHVIQGIHETGRVVLVDIESESAIAHEMKRRASEGSLYDETARIGLMKTLGANYLIIGSVARIGADKVPSNFSAPSYHGNVVFTLKIISTEDGSIVGTETYEYSGMTGGTASSPGQAINEGIAKAQKAMMPMVSKYFKAKGTIVEMGEMKNGKVHTCYVNLGSSSGVKKGQSFNVNHNRMIAGIEASEQIGKLKVEAIVAGELSKCKVVAGQDEILAAFQAGEEIRIMTKQKKETGRKMADTGRKVAGVGRNVADVGNNLVKVGRQISNVVKHFR